MTRRIGFMALERYAAGYTVRESLATLKRDGTTRAVGGRMLSMKEYNEVPGLGTVEQWEKRYLRRPGLP